MSRTPGPAIRTGFAAPVEEVDPVARVDDDHEAVGPVAGSASAHALGYGRMPKRRRGSRTARTQPRRLTRHRPVRDAGRRGARDDPEPFAAALDEVAIVIADEPTAEQRRRRTSSAPDETLYGLYEGVPRTEWGADWVADPNRITLFRLPLEEDFADPDDLADEVWVTVIHELAHHLGIDDDRLHELGVD